jgi:hypothetical protein
MKTLFTTLTAGLLAISFAASANAVPSKASRTAMAQHEASCKAQAAKKFSAIHFIKRKNFVNDCMGYNAQAKVVKKHKTKKTKAH